MSSIVATLIQELQNLRISSYVTIAGVTILWYDWFLTFADEVEHIWKGKLTTVKVIYLVNRYTVPFVLAIDIYNYVGPGFAEPVNNLTKPLFVCVAWLFVDAVWNWASFATIHWLITMRVWSIYGRQKNVFNFLSFTFVICQLGTLVITIKASLLMVPDGGPIPIANICYGQIPSFFWTVWVPNLIFEAVLFAMMCIKAAQHSKARVITPILGTLYRDGVIYFLVICFSDIFNLLSWVAAPPSFILLSKFFTMAIVNVAAFRLILDLRDVGSQSRSQTSFSAGGPGTGHRLRQLGTNSAFSLMRSGTTSYETPYPYPIRLGTGTEEVDGIKKKPLEELEYIRGPVVQLPTSSTKELVERSRALAFQATASNAPPRFERRTHYIEDGWDMVVGHPA